MDPEIARLLQEEYIFLQSIYEGYNDQSLLIKGWSVTVGMATLVAVYVAKPSDRPGRTAVLVAALSVVPFYLTDALWKAVQFGYVSRIREIEYAFRFQTPIEPMQAYSKWVGVTYESYKKAAKSPTVLLPHVAIFGTGLVLWIMDVFASFLSSPGSIQAASRKSAYRPGVPRR